MSCLISFEPFFQFEFWLIKNLVEVFVSCILANKENILLITEETVKFGDIRMVKEHIDLNLSHNILHNPLFLHSLLL